MTSARASGYVETARSGEPPWGALRRRLVETKHTAGGYVVANGVDRATADRLRNEHGGAVVSRNADGTYRVTKGR